MGSHCQQLLSRGNWEPIELKLSPIESDRARLNGIAGGDLLFGVGVFADKCVSQELNLLLSFILCQLLAMAHTLSAHNCRTRARSRVGNQLTVHVNKRQVGARVDHALSNNETQAASTASDDTDIALQGEAGERGLDVLALLGAQDGLGAGQLVLLGVNELDVRVGSRVRAGFIIERNGAVEVARGGEGLARD